MNTKKTDTFPTPEACLAHRVSYGETDGMGQVYYAEYMHFCERARGFYCRELGMSYALIEEKGILLPVREMQGRFRAPVRYDELIHIRAGISTWSRASMTFIYEIWNQAKDKLHFTGMTQHACVNRQGKPVGVPDWLKEQFS